MKNLESTLVKFVYSPSYIFIVWELEVAFESDESGKFIAKICKVVLLSMSWSYNLIKKHKKWKLYIHSQYKYNLKVLEGQRSEIYDQRIFKFIKIHFQYWRIWCIYCIRILWFHTLGGMVWVRYFNWFTLQVMIWELKFQRVTIFSLWFLF